jgi:hypothetical protein
MSDQQNVQTVQDAYAAFGRGDIQAILNRLTDDVEWFLPGEGEIPQAGLYRGKEGVSRFFQVLAQDTEFSRFEPGTYIAQGDHVVALGRYKAKVRQTGRSFEAEWAMVFTFRGGKIAKFHEYTDTSAISRAYQAAKAA